MAILHAQAGEVVNISPLGKSLPETKTSALIKTANFEVIRLVLLAGKEIAKHQAKGEIIVQCLEGMVLFNWAENDVELKPGTLLYLKSGESHAVKAIANSVLMLTIVFNIESKSA